MGESALVPAHWHREVATLWRAAAEPGLVASLCDCNDFWGVGTLLGAAAVCARGVDGVIRLEVPEAAAAAMQSAYAWATKSLIAAARDLETSGGVVKATGAVSSMHDGMLSTATMTSSPSVPALLRCALGVTLFSTAVPPFQSAPSTAENGNAAPCIMRHNDQYTGNAELCSSSSSSSSSSSIEATAAARASVTAPSPPPSYVGPGPAYLRDATRGAQLLPRDSVIAIANDDVSQSARAIGLPIPKVRNWMSVMMHVRGMYEARPRCGGLAAGKQRSAERSATLAQLAVYGAASGGVEDGNVATSLDGAMRALERGCPPDEWDSAIFGPGRLEGIAQAPRLALSVLRDAYGIAANDQVLRGTMRKRERGGEEGDVNVAEATSVDAPNTAPISSTLIAAPAERVPVAVIDDDALPRADVAETPSASDVNVAVLRESDAERAARREILRESDERRARAAAAALAARSAPFRAAAESAFTAPKAACDALARALADATTFAKQLAVYRGQTAALGGASAAAIPPVAPAVNLVLHALALYALNRGGSSTMHHEAEWAAAAAAAGLGSGSAKAALAAWVAHELSGFEATYLKRLAAKFR